MAQITTTIHKNDNEPWILVVPGNEPGSEYFTEDEKQNFISYFNFVKSLPGYEQSEPQITHSNNNNTITTTRIFESDENAQSAFKFLFSQNVNELHETVKIKNEILKKKMAEHNLTYKITHLLT